MRFRLAARLRKSAPAEGTARCREAGSRGAWLWTRRSKSATRLRRRRRCARDIFLDGEEAAISVDARLAQLVNLARERGSAIAIGHAHDATLAALQRWLPTLSRQGVVLVPLTAVVKARGG